MHRTGILAPIAAASFKPYRFKNRAKSGTMMERKPTFVLLIKKAQTKLGLLQKLLTRTCAVGFRYLLVLLIVCLKPNLVAKLE